MLVFCDMTLLLVTIYYKMLVVYAMTVIVNHLPEDASLLRYEIVSLVTIYQTVASLLWWRCVIDNHLPEDASLMICDAVLLGKYLLILVRSCNTLETAHIQEDFNLWKQFRENLSLTAIYQLTQLEPSSALLQRSLDSSKMSVTVY